MHLPHRFYKFAFRFDTARLQAEAAALPDEAWQTHPTGFRGNSAALLITTGGGLNEDTAPPMQPTDYLRQCPYIMQVMARFRTLHGRARLMRLEPGCGVPPHVDFKYYWRKRTRVHIPIITNPDILFHCESEIVHMAAGEAWTFDNWRVHQVVNETETRRIHLTFDTIGSSAFWAMARPDRERHEEVFVPFEPEMETQLACESYAGPPAMAPGELDAELGRLMADATAHPRNDPAALARFSDFIAKLKNDWSMCWHATEPDGEGLRQLRGFVEQVRSVAAGLPNTVCMASNGQPAIRSLMPVLSAMIAAGSKPDAVRPARAQEPSPAAPQRAAHRSPRFERPIFIVSAPRSGSTMLFEMLANNRGFWTLGDEAHAHVESIPSLAPRNRGFDSNRLTEADAQGETRAQLHANFVKGLRDAAGQRYITLANAAPDTVRFLEKTPKNALRIPFLRAVYPDAKFIFLYRDAKANISSIMEAWRSGKFVTFRNLPGWTGQPWSLLLLPGWRELNGAELAEVALSQWCDTNTIILDDLAALPRADWCAMRYEDLTAYPRDALKTLCRFAGVEFGEEMRQLVRQPPRLSRYTLTPPSADKWRSNAEAILPRLARTEAVARRLAALEPARA